MNKQHSGSSKNSEDLNSENNFNDSNLRLVLYNDDINEFAYVISCLIEILECSDQQAEQLTLLAHYKGSVTVKQGPAGLLNTLSDSFKMKGLISAVQQNDQK